MKGEDKKQHMYMEYLDNKVGEQKKQKDRYRGREI